MWKDFKIRMGRIASLGLNKDETKEIWYQGRRVASHPRLYTKGRLQTQEVHRPHSHKQYLEWTPERILAWCRDGPFDRGPGGGKVIASRRHPEQGLRSCLGILRLAQRYDPQRLENACRRALGIQGYSYLSVRSILERGLDREPLSEPKPGEQTLPFFMETSAAKTTTTDEEDTMIVEVTLEHAAEDF